MKVELKIREYTPETGVGDEWHFDSNVTTAFFIGGEKVDTKNCSFLISGNSEGLVSLARVLLHLSQENVPDGSHVHYDDFAGLEDDSCELILQRGVPKFSK